MIAKYCRQESELAKAMMTAKRVFNPQVLKELLEMLSDVVPGELPEADPLMQIINMDLSAKPKPVRKGKKGYARPLSRG